MILIRVCIVCQKEFPLERPSRKTKYCSRACYLKPRTISQDLQRFMSYVDKTSSPIGCWLWTGALTHGYAVFSENGTNIYGHRWSYEHFVGLIPGGMFVDHVCRNRRCVNPDPDHLEAVTHVENMKRARGKIVRTHCREGHLYGVGNARVYTKSNGLTMRYCVVCDKERSKKRVRKT